MLAHGVSTPSPSVLSLLNVPTCRDALKQRRCYGKSASALTFVTRIGIRLLWRTRPLEPRKQPSYKINTHKVTYVSRRATSRTSWGRVERLDRLPLGSEEAVGFTNRAWVES